MKHMRSINENPPTTDPFVALQQLREMFYTQQIFKHPWFSRVWIIQEVAMAKIEPLVGYGHEWIPWSNLFNTYTTVTHISLGDFRGALPAFFHILRGHNLAVLNTMREKKGETSLEWYLRATSQFQAIDLRDKVYSLLGLARERDHCNFVPDYDKTNTPESLYAKVVQHFIDIDHSLNILSYFRKPLEIPASPLTPWQGYKVSNLGMAR
jgi:hypothetical protein